MSLVFVPVVAQDFGNGDVATWLDLSSFTGIVAIVSLIVTQIAKLIPVVESKTILKILVSAVAGVVISFVGWKFSFAAFLYGLSAWQALLYGVFAGLSACGFYDLIKSVGKFLGFNTD